MPRPAQAKVLTGKWIFKHKFQSNYSLKRYKMHWVLHGFTQWPSVDFAETFSPVVKPTTVHTMLCL
jgi:histone deacetylase 1/2